MKTGPKALAPKAFAAKHAIRLNYKLIAVVEARKFIVSCLDCDLERTVSFVRSVGQKCSCTHKRKFYAVKRTPELHTEEIRAKGYKQYACVEVGKLSKDKNLYRHSCGAEFKMSKDCFVGSGEPCAVCRKENGYTHAQYVKMAKLKGLVPLERYGSRKEIRHRVIKCGHVRTINVGAVTRSRIVNVCKTCKPSTFWHSGTVQGKRFKVRSRVEIAFLKALVAKGYKADQIEYEPLCGRIEYFNPVKNRDAFYTPDFKVNQTYVEVKDLSSLGLKTYNWMTAEEALIENRAKCEAARKSLGAYKMFVYHKNEFHEVHDFWKHREQARITKRLN